MAYVLNVALEYWRLYQFPVANLTSDSKPGRLKQQKEEFLAVQWLGLHVSTAGGMGSFPGWGTRSYQPCGYFLKLIKINKACCYCCYVASVVSDSVQPHRQQPTRLPCLWDSPGNLSMLGCL